MPNRMGNGNNYTLNSAIKYLENNKKTDQDEASLEILKDAKREEIAKKELDQRKKIEELVHQAKLENLKKEGKVLQAGLEEAGDKFQEKLEEATNKLVSGIQSGDYTKSLTSTLDGIIDNYISAQESLSAHLVGSNTQLSDMINNLNGALSSTSLVKQESVYNNLSKLVESGIVYNVEQRAFLETLSQDLDMTFNAADGTLSRLIRLQTEDLSANRMAIEYSLQEFLNQNYNTSEYIKGAFTDVSSAIIEMQSLVSASQAVSLETGIQTWLGTYYSAGVDKSTVTSLASAINALGSGDISNLGSGISNLVLMGAARMGMDYGGLLTNGLSTADLDKLMTGITGYLQEINSGYSSNVVKSQLASLFGVKVSDLVASGNLRATTGTVSSDIYSTVLSDLGSLVPWQQWIQNSLGNAMFTWGTSIASDSGEYIAYEIEKLISNSGIGTMVNEWGNTLGGLGGLALNLLGTGLSNAPLLSLFTSGAFENILSSISGTVTSGASNIFDSLYRANTLGSVFKFSGSNQSGTMYISTGTEDLLNGSSSTVTDFSNSINNYTGDTEEPIDFIRSDVASILDFLTNNLLDLSGKVSELNETIGKMDFGQLGGY